jgi:uncharacterized SAM-binding protein YcdF (DUF218 family)
MKKRIFLIIPVLVAFLLLYALRGFVQDMNGPDLNVHDMNGQAMSGQEASGAYAGGSEEADAIVVLTGGAGRIEEGLMMLRRGRSPKMILSGVHRDADLDSIFIRGLEEGERVSIILEKSSESTYENALEVKRLFDELGLDSMVLITSVYHMKRAYQTFRRIMPEDVRIEAFPVTSPNFDTERWWGWTGLTIIFPEFVKYYWYEVRFGVEGALA